MCKDAKQCNLASPPKYAIRDTPAFDYAII